MKSIYVVLYTELVEKQVRKVPAHIELKLVAWAKAVEARGLEEVRLQTGYHDEPLKGARVGQRSIRLSRSYRAIYEVTEQGKIKIVEIKEVTKHEY